MTISAAGPVSFLSLKNEFGDSNPVSLNEYYAGGGLVLPNTYGSLGLIPSAGQIGLANFRGVSGSLLGGAGWAQIPVSNPLGPTIYLGDASLLSADDKVSTDGGRNWELHQMVYPESVVALGIQYSSIIGWVGGYFVAYAKAGNVMHILTSTDATNWSVYVTYPAALFAPSIYFLPDGLCVGSLASQSIFFVSQSANNTAANRLINAAGQVVPAGDTHLSQLGRSTFFAGASGGTSVGADGLFILHSPQDIRYVYTSPDGINWTARSVYNSVGSLLTTGIRTYYNWLGYSWVSPGVIFNGKYLIMVSYYISAGTRYARLLTSSDGINFTLKDPFPTSLMSTGSAVDTPLIASCSTYVLCVFKNNSSGYSYATSTDGTSWTERATLTIPGTATLYKLLNTGSEWHLQTNVGVFVVPV